MREIDEPSAGAPGPAAIVLHGPTSAGKSSLAKALQDGAPVPAFHVALDAFVTMSRRRDMRGPQEEGEAYCLHCENLRSTLARLADTRFEIVADLVLRDEAQLRECLRVLSGRPLYLVGVRAPLDILEERERRREDRAAGMARVQTAHPAFARDYDLVIDTSTCSAEEGAAAIRSFIRCQPRVAALGTSEAEMPSHRAAMRAVPPVSSSAVLVRALLAYSIHEHQDPAGTATRVVVKLQRRRCSIEDDGRGMGLHRDGYVPGLLEQLAGRRSEVALHGIGLAIVAMSSPHMCIESRRGGHLLTQEFAWGAVQGPVRSTPWDGPTGTRVTFTLPDDAPGIAFGEVMAQVDTWRVAYPGLRIEVSHDA